MEQYLINRIKELKDKLKNVEICGFDSIEFLTLNAGLFELQNALKYLKENQDGK